MSRWGRGASMRGGGIGMAGAALGCGAMPGRGWTASCWRGASILSVRCGKKGRSRSGRGC